MLHNQDNPLIIAVKNNDIATVESLIKAKADVEAKDINGLTPLVLAAREGREVIMRMLLDAKANIEAKNEWSYTPLVLATSGRHDACVRMLLDEKANIEAKNERRGYSLILAAARGQEAVTRMLLKAKANTEVVDYFGTPLLHAVENNEAAVVRLLVDANANVEAIDLKRRHVPLARAVLNGNEAIVRILLDAKANPFVQSYVSQSLLQPAGSPAIQILLKTAEYRWRHQGKFALCAGFHSQVGARSFLSERTQKSALFHRQVLRLLFASAGDASGSPAKESAQSETQQRFPSSD